VVLFLAGCNGCGGEDEEVETVDSDEGTRPRGEGQVGTVRGVIRLADGAELPTYPEIVLRGDDRQPAWPESCTPPQRRDRQPVQMDEDRGLSHVMVTATGDEDAFGAALPEWEPQVYEASIRDCRLTPPIISTTRGDKIVLTNETEYPFLPVLGGANQMVALLHGEQREIVLDEGGVKSLTCGFAAPCGRLDIVVSFHPVHTLTEEDGSFTLENVPAGQEVELHVWHPLFQETRHTLTLERGDTEEVELVLEPAPQQAPPTTEMQGHPEDDPDTVF